MRQSGYYILGLYILLALGSCSPQYTRHLSEYHFSSPDDRPDYSRLDYWAAHPDKKDLADSVPPPLQPLYIRDSLADVFFVHPTTFASQDTGSWNADINDSLLNAKTDYTTILYQASCFNECRLFAPRYRQANLKAYYTADSASAARAFELAYQDIRRAFLYYLEHYNQGRPIIIASHSQGSTHAKRLLREFFDGRPLQHRLVAAYILGMGIPRDFFTSLKPCSDSTQTGCVISWRTFLEGYEPAYIKKEMGSSIAINPLTWNQDTDPAPRTLNKGGILPGFSNLVPRVSDAQVHDGVLWIHRPHFKGSILYRTKNYHIADINLFYVNIRDNLRTRLAAYRQNLTL